MRNVLKHGATFMCGLIVGLTMALAGWQSAPTNGLQMVKINDHDVPLLGRWEGDRLHWKVDEQNWTPCPPYIDGCMKVQESLKSDYTIGINGTACVVRGWVNGKGVFQWCWRDQKRSGKPPKSSTPTIDPPGVVGQDGVLNFGIKAEALDADGAKLRASDVETKREVQAVIAANKPGGDCPGGDCPDDSPPSRIPNIPDVAPAGIAALLVWFAWVDWPSFLMRAAFVAVIVGSLALIIRRNARG